MTKTYTHIDWTEEEWVYGPDGISFKTNDPLYNALQQFIKDFENYLEHIKNMTEEEREEWLQNVIIQNEKDYILNTIDEILDENMEIFSTIDEEDE